MPPGHTAYSAADPGNLKRDSSELGSGLELSSQCLHFKFSLAVTALAAEYISFTVSMLKYHCHLGFVFLISDPISFHIKILFSNIPKL